MRRSASGNLEYKAPAGGWGREAAQDRWFDDNFPHCGHCHTPWLGVDIDDWVAVYFDDPTKGGLHTTACWCDDEDEIK